MTPEKDEKGRFISGNIGGPGRGKGTRNKIGEAFLEALYADFQQGGAEAIVQCRETKPDAYVKVIASLLPQEVKVTANPLSEMTDDELARLIDLIRAADGATIEAAGGNAEKNGPPVAH